MFRQKPERYVPPYDSSVPDLLECFFVDVGQGNCTILKTYTNPNEFNCWIFDAGSTQYQYEFSKNFLSSSYFLNLPSFKNMIKIWCFPLMNI